MELIVSVQTDTLGTDPQLCVRSTFATQQTQRYVDSPDATFTPVDIAASEDVASNGYLITQDNATERIAYFVHPDDYYGTSLSRDDSPQGATLHIANSLFAGDLEKGVILRGRLMVFFLAGSDSAMVGQADSAIAAYRRFATQPLPLGT